jgi:hypothetical protein
MIDLRPLAWISADLSNSITARQLENIPELGCDPSQLYPIPLYPKEAVMSDKASIRPDMVRELEWTETRHKVWSAPTSIGNYQIYTYRSGAVDLTFGEKQLCGECGSIGAAKSAAQADYASRIASALSPAFLERIAALEEENVTPRGGVKRNWWEEYQKLRREFRKLEKAARDVLAETDRILAEDEWPLKYRAPYGPLTKLREALPETYEEFKAARTTLQDHAEDGGR